MNNGSKAAVNGENQVSNEEKIKKEQQLPIFEDYEMVENGKAVQKWMLSLNGMYISGISLQQLKLLHGAVQKVLSSK